MKEKRLLSLFIIVFGLLIVGNITLIKAEAVDKLLDITVSCSNSTYANISYIKYISDSTYIINSETIMTKKGNKYNYTISSNLNNRTENLEYSYHCDVNGIDVSSGDIINITSTGLNGTLLLIILVTVLSFCFLILSLFGNTEFFLFVSGCLFLLDGIFMMIFGLNDIMNWYTRSIAFVSLGVGLLLTIGSYLDSDGFGSMKENIVDNYDYFEE